MKKSVGMFLISMAISVSHAQERIISEASVENRTRFSRELPRDPEKVKADAFASKYNLPVREIDSQGRINVPGWLLEKAGITMADIGLIEMNEAFAAQIIANEKVFAADDLAEKYLGQKAMGAIDRQIMNVNGGAIAMGHPVGSSGTRLILTLLQEMGKRSVDLGLATLCVGGGQGAAVLLRRP